MIFLMASTGQPVGRRDVAIAGVASVLGILLMFANVQDKSVNASVLAIPLFLAVTLPILWRRARPLAALVATLAALLVHIALFGTVTRCGVLFPVVFALVFAAGARLETRDGLVGMGLGVVLVLVVCVSDSSVDMSASPVFVALTAAAWGVGRIVRSRGRMVSELQTRTSELRDARDERARLEIATDRARLSAELDQLLQRRLGELARLADAGSRSSDAEAAQVGLIEIERESRRTLEEMRSIVGVLRADESGLSTAPQPALTQLDALLVRVNGPDARLRIEGNPRVLPASLELSAYRIVEQLLSALDEGAEVDVRVRFGEDALEIAVAGPARRRGEAAIARARERAQLHSGTLEATTSGGRAEAVVHLPMLAGA
jgi:hypothetical protein